jgi:twitching motility protein PilJ
MTDTNAPTTLSSAPPLRQTVSGERGGWLQNARLGTKVTAVTLVPTIGLFAVGALLLGGLSQTRFHLTNIYEFMLIPITAIGDAQTNLASAEGDLIRLQQPGLSAAERSDLIKDIRGDVAKAENAVKKYNTDWVTTVSPEFTAILKDSGHLDWQVKEVASLGALNTSFKTATEQLAAVIRNPDSAQAAQARAALNLSRTNLGDLIAVNLQFADLSYKAANQAQQSATQRSYWITGLAVLLSLSLVLWLVRSLTRRLQALTRGAQALGDGQYNYEIKVGGEDEVGVVASSMNTSLRQMDAYRQREEVERQENQKLQSNIGQFLDVTMNIADGDLTQRGKVSDDVLGNVVDSINVMVEELGGVLRGVRTASGSVSQASLEMLGTTDQIVRGADSTAAQTVRVAAQVQDVIAGIREMNTAAQQSADVARQSLVASQQGREAVLGTLDGMQNIRREVQGVAEGMRGLSARSLEIQEVVDTISQFSSQTNLLALNASIEASDAGEAGHRFAVVADEVRKLADSSAEATARIASLIRTVQLEISEVVTSVQGGTREVEQGYRVASAAGERLEELGRLSNQAAQFAEAISAATGQQVSSIEQMGAAVSQIGEVAEQSRLSVQQGRAAAERLRPLTQDLDSSLERFQLPV